MMNMPEISIIIPTYNSSLFIKRTIQSVLSQTFTDWELLIVDDCSTDNTRELVENYTKKDSRIKLYKTPQNSGGPATPKNIGIENAQGKYVAFLDHDDEWLPEKINKQLELFESSMDDKLGLVSFFLNIRDNDGKLLYQHKKNYRGDIIKQLAGGNFIVTCSCVMIKLIILKEVGSFDKAFKTSDDWDMWLRIAEAGYHFDFVPENLINYVSHGSNAHMGNDDRNDAREFRIIYNKHSETFLKYNSKAVGSYYFYEKKYNLARKYFIKNIFSKESDFDQKIKSFAFVLLTFTPKLETCFRNIFSKIKNLINF